MAFFTNMSPYIYQIFVHFYGYIFLDFYMYPYYNELNNKQINQIFLGGIITMMNARTIEKELEQRKDKSAWNKGVTAYALELLEDVADNEEVTKERLLNGASDWNQYSWGGSSLIYDEDIAKRLCTPSELKKTRNGERRPNASEEWLDTQARALYQACNRIMRIARQ